MRGLPRWLSSKESTCSAGAAGGWGSIPGSQRSPGEGNGNPLQLPTHSSAWRIPWMEEPGGCSPQGAKSQTRLKWLTTRRRSEELGQRGLEIKKETGRSQHGPHRSLSGLVTGIWESEWNGETIQKLTIELLLKLWVYLLFFYREHFQIHRKDERTVQRTPLCPRRGSVLVNVCHTSRAFSHACPLCDYFCCCC